MTFGSLFSGIGGMDLGLERAGWEVRWQVEIDPFCQRVLAEHWPGVKRYGDIREVDWSGVEPVDLIAGGFPCQPFSSAGARRGLADERWLWPDYARAVRALRPRRVLVENVPGFLGRSGGMAVVLGDLAACGYDAEWDCIPAAAVGAPHRRDRIWLIGYADRDGESVSAFDVEASELPGLVADAHGEPLVGSAIAWAERHSWEPEPAVGRVVDGLPAAVDELRGLGNAVVPQVAQWIGERILSGADDAG